MAGVYDASASVRATPVEMLEGLYAIIDVPHRHGLTVADQTAAVLCAPGGRPCAIQLRAKTASPSERLAMLEAMAPACQEAGVPLIVNDDIEAAVRGPDGVGGLHLGQDDEGAQSIADIRERVRTRPGFLIGLSSHNTAQLREACGQSPDYVAVGPVGPTKSKKNPDPTLGFEGLLEACRMASRPVVAIGGLDAASGARAIELGAAAVAVISSLMHPTSAATSAATSTLLQQFAAAAKPLPFERVVEAIPVLPPEQLEELARWGDDLSVHIGLGLPARFSPRIEDGKPVYRARDLLDLLYVLDKQPGETWDAWKGRAAGGDVDNPLVQLRRV